MGLTLLNRDGIIVIAKQYHKNDYGDLLLDIYIENNTQKNLCFQCRNSSINGYMIDAYLSTDGNSMKKANCHITFEGNELKRCGIDIIADMEFSFHIFNSNNLFDNYLNSNPIIIRTKNADSYDYSFDDSGVVIYDENNIKIVCKRHFKDTSTLDSKVVFYIENNRSEGITVTSRDFSVNDFMADGIFSCDVCPGKHAIHYLTIWSSELSKNDIVDVNKIQLYFVISPLNGLFPIYKTKSKIITFKTNNTKDN